MTWFDYALISWLAFGAIMMVLLIGKPRDPITPGTAVISLFVNAAIVVGLVLVG